jgi:plasmid stabilization system protein ParE
MTVVYTTTSLAEISEILSYIAADNLKAAASVAEEIEDTILRIEENPKIATVVYKKDVRAIIVGRFDYRIFFTVNDGQSSFATYAARSSSDRGSRDRG